MLYKKYMAKKIKVFDSEKGYNLAAPSYDTKEKYLNSFEQGKLAPLIGEVIGRKILDVGAGTGRVSTILSSQGALVTALDVSEKMLSVLKKKNKQITTVVGDAEALPFPDASFDVVVSAFVIVHLKDPTRFFDEAYRVLKDGGLLVVTNINQKDAPPVKTPEGDIIIESFYHRPEKIRELLESLAYTIEKEIFTKENNVWINQIIAARK